MREKNKICALFSRLLIIVAYLSLFPAQSSFQYSIASLEHQNKLEQLNKGNQPFASSFVYCAKGDNHKVNIRLNKRFQKVSPEFLPHSIIELSVLIHNRAFNYFSYIEPVLTYSSASNLTRGPPRANI